MELTQDWRRSANVFIQRICCWIFFTKKTMKIRIFMMRQLNLKQFWQGYLMRHVKGELLKTALCTETCLTQRLWTVWHHARHRYRLSLQKDMRFLQKRRQTISTNWVRTAIISVATEWKKTANGKWTALMVRLISQSTYQNRRKIQRRLRLRRMQRQVVIQNVSSVWRMKDMQVVWTIRREKTTVLSRSQWMTAHGDSSIRHMYIIMNTVSYLMVSIRRWKLKNRHL